MSIKISPKHGLNPSVVKCYFCGGGHSVVLFGRLKGDVEAPREVCVDRVPCDECEALMRQGVLLISVRDGEQGEDPYRTGGWCVVKDDALCFVSDDEVRASILRKRAAFIPDQVWDLVGLPRGES